MSNVLIHLGLAKTGTSWLQKRVFPQLDVDYFHCGHYEILNKIPKSDRSMVVSYEGFSGTIPLNDRYVNAWRLHKIFPSAKIFLMVRNRERYSNSLYSQHIKNGGVCTKNDFVRLIESHLYFMNWDIYIQYLQRLWGRDKVKISWFEDMVSDYDGFLQELCDFIGVGVPSGIDVSPLNRGLSVRQVRVWRKWNQWFRSKWNQQAVLPKWLNPCFIYKNMEWFNE